MKYSVLRIQTALIIVSFLAIGIAISFLFLRQKHPLVDVSAQADSTFFVCGNAPRTPATAEILRGEMLFKENCRSCHALVTQEVGPPLRDVLDRRSEEWTKQFIRDAQVLLSKKDTTAIRLKEEYGLPHTTFEELSDKDLEDLFAYFKWDR